MAKREYLFDEDEEAFLSHLFNCRLLLREYGLIYDKGDLRLELLGVVAPEFFGRVQRIWYDRLVLDVARLMDPPGSESNKNLSLRRFVAGSIEHLSESDRARVDLHLMNCCRAAKVFRRIRSKLLAHYDLQTVTKKKIKKGPGTIRIEKFYDEVQSIVTIISRTRTNAARYIIPMPQGDVEQVVYAMAAAEHYLSLGKNDRLAFMKERDNWRYRDALRNSRDDLRRDN